MYVLLFYSSFTNLFFQPTMYTTPVFLIENKCDRNVLFPFFRGFVVSLNYSLL
jgi:hypothetical protein